MVPQRISNTTTSCSLSRTPTSIKSVRRTKELASFLCITMMIRSIFVGAFSSPLHHIKTATIRAYGGQPIQGARRLPFKIQLENHSLKGKSAGFGGGCWLANGAFVSALGNNDLSKQIFLNRKHSTGIFMSATEDDDKNGDSTAATAESDDNDNQKTLSSEWNVPGLKKEVTRLTVRCHKKIGKAAQRLRKAQEEVDRLTSSPDVTMEELEQCPNVDEIEADLSDLQQRLKKLNQLEVLLTDVKTTKKNPSIVLPEHVASLALELEVSDEEPARAEKAPKKNKGPKNMQAFRLPYRRYYTVNKTEIRVSAILSA